MRVEVNVKLGNRTRNLRADLHSDHRVDCSGGFDDLLYFTVLDPGSVVLRGTAAPQLKGGESDHTGKEQEHDRNSSLC